MSINIKIIDQNLQEIEEYRFQTATEFVMPKVGDTFQLEYTTYKVTERVFCGLQRIEIYVKDVTYE